MPGPNTLIVNELFQSIQGEGYWTGTPAFFIRLSGCDLQCSFCDTAHDTGTIMTFEELYNSVPQRFKHIVITGGEPTIQDGLIDFVLGFDLNTRIIHIETNGTQQDVVQQLNYCHNIWITVSPKNRAGEESIPYCDEVKLVVKNEVDVSNALSLHERYGKHGILFYLQPVSQEVAATRLCVASCMAHPEKFNLSLQTHKFIGIV